MRLNGESGFQQVSIPPFLNKVADVRTEGRCACACVLGREKERERERVSEELDDHSAHV